MFDDTAKCAASPMKAAEVFQPPAAEDVQVYEGDGRDRDADFAKEVRRRKTLLDELDKEIECRKAIKACQPEQPKSSPWGDLKCTSTAESAIASMRRTRGILFRLVAGAACVSMFATALSIVFLASRQDLGALMVFGACFGCCYLTLSGMVQWRVE